MGIYRGREGMWSWILHRVSGLGVLFFLLFHVVDTALIGWGPEIYNRALALYSLPAFRVGEVVLVAGVLYHALNGIRVILIDFWTEGTRYHRTLFWVEMILFFALFLPTAYIMMAPIFL